MKRDTPINKLIINRPSSKLLRVITPNSIIQMEGIGLTTMSGIFRIKFSMQTRKSLLSCTLLYFVKTLPYNERQVIVINDFPLG